MYPLASPLTHVQTVPFAPAPPFSPAPFLASRQATWKCMTYKATDILPIEAEQRAKLKWGCYNADKVVK